MAILTSHNEITGSLHFREDRLLFIRANLVHSTKENSHLDVGYFTDCGDFSRFLCNAHLCYRITAKGRSRRGQFTKPETDFTYTVHQFADGQGSLTLTSENRAEVCTHNLKNLTVYSLVFHSWITGFVRSF